MLRYNRLLILLHMHACVTRSPVFVHLNKVRLLFLDICRAYNIVLYYATSAPKRWFLYSIFISLASFRRQTPLVHDSSMCTTVAYPISEQAAQNNDHLVHPAKPNSFHSGDKLYTRMTITYFSHLLFNALSHAIIRM